MTWCQRAVLLCCPEPSSSAQYSVCQFLWSYESQWHTFGQQMVDTAWKQNNDKQVNANTNNWLYTCTLKSNIVTKIYLNKRVAHDHLKTIESCAYQSCQTLCSCYRLYNRVSLKVSPKGSLYVHTQQPQLLVHSLRNSSHLTDHLEWNSWKIGLQRHCSCTICFCSQRFNQVSLCYTVVYWNQTTKIAEWYKWVTTCICYT